MKLYIYSIIDSNKSIDGSINGLEGAPVFNIPYRDIGVAASELNGQMQNITEDCVLGHEEVVERLMAKFTVLPVRLLTVFNTKEDVLSMMEDYYSDFKRNLDRLREKVEFGVKVIWSGDEIKKRIIDAYKGSEHGVPISGDSPEKNFIREKFKSYKIEKDFEEEADKYIATVDKFFSGVVVEKRLGKLKSTNLLLSASYLVEKEREDDFREAFERLSCAHGDLRYLFSGPWPPYNFVTLKEKIGQWTK